MKTNFYLLFILTLILLACSISKSSNKLNEVGRIKVCVMYPSGDGKTFDMDYYKKYHLPMMQRLMGPGMKGYSIDRGIGSGTPGVPMQYEVIGYLYFENIHVFNEGMTKHLEEVKADIPKYTNIIPTVWISEVEN